MTVVCRSCDFSGHQLLNLLVGLLLQLVDRGYAFFRIVPRIRLPFSGFLGPGPDSSSGFAVRVQRTDGDVPIEFSLVTSDFAHAAS